MFSANRAPGQLRRVVTAFSADGKSIIESDTVLDAQFVAPAGVSYSSTIWTTNTSPAKVKDPVDGAVRTLQGRGIRSPNGL